MEEIFAVMEREDVEMAEIRLDLCPLSDQDITELFSLCDKPLVATCRMGEGAPQEAERRLSLAMEAGAKYCDLELEAPAPVGKRLRRKAAETGSIFIRSYHNYDYTPSAEELHAIVGQCRRFGAEVVKIAVKANSAEDVSAVESLYADYPEGSLLAFCMGAAGVQSRVDCLRLGAPFSFAALGDKTAEGQLQLAEMNRELYGGFKPYNRAGIEVPASKSMAQRAIIAAALAEGTSHLSGYTPCEDSASAIAAARAIGAEIQEGPTLVIRGIGGKTLELDSIDVGESGLLTRMLIPVLAMKNGGKAFEVRGRGTLPTRPLAGAAQIMASFGVMLENLEAAGKE
ncbi:MAG: type I 3-dehydroquinate dehydratase, partial [Bacteroidales bacterium]|nr:type I 3-dehydroquinate dehydratase [Bacteroidales bacterium]